MYLNLACVARVSIKSFSSRTPVVPSNDPHTVTDFHDKIFNVFKTYLTYSTYLTYFTFKYVFYELIFFFRILIKYVAYVLYAYGMLRMLQPW